jgi:hypothetical protein
MTLRCEPRNAMSSANPIRRVLVTVFVLFHLCAIFIWSFPIRLRPLQRAKSMVAPYMVWSGLSQGWAFFAPDPVNSNNYLDAQITFRDGQKTIWKFPMPQDVGYFRRYFMDRQLMWSSDSLRLDENSGLWPDAARYIARLNNNRDNPPKTIELIRHWWVIAPPNSGNPETWRQYTFFTYSVLAGDLL